MAEPEKVWILRVMFGSGRTDVGAFRTEEAAKAGLITWANEGREQKDLILRLLGSRPPLERRCRSLWAGRYRCRTSPAGQRAGTAAAPRVCLKGGRVESLLASGGRNRARAMRRKFSVAEKTGGQPFA
jgi:hypothetical protein